MKKVKIFALFAAVLTSVLMFVFLKSIVHNDEAHKTDVIVATQTIPMETPITQSMFTLTQLPDEAILDGVITDSAAILGKVAKSEIVAGEQIIHSKLLTAGDVNSGTLGYSLEPGMRAVTMAVDGISGIGYMIEPGNRVDIIAQYSQNDTAFTKLIVQNVVVLATDSNLSNNENTMSKDESYSTITLQATPEQVMEIRFYEYTGRLSAILRSPLDDKIINLPIKQF
ncbi:Flp pilus assembly protein CpaB [Anaerotignum sp.]|uniref:Flp pilus assembly protein CpaB n=1 Tax=Anaerotignum sp. TaxID=2039241 RepID=UPI0027149232|nr:Flp pilus assembly protein CpaB [Anaerotignum sp.]